MDATQADRPKRAGVYCRLSYAPDGSVEKVERQESDCRALAQRLGWDVSDRHVYVDNSRSAWQRKRKRPAWERMLLDVEADQIDGLLVYHGDRLIRQPYDLERLLGVADSRGVRLASPSGTRDLDSPDDRFILRIEAAQACREVDNTSRRVKRALAANVKLGKTQRGGHRPYGYGVLVGTKTAVDRKTGAEVEVPVWDTDQLNSAEAPYLAEAAERLLAGQSQTGVVEWMRAEGVVTTEGGEMTTRGLRHLMLAPRVAGLIRHAGDLYPAAWPAILARETWEAVCAYYRRSAELYPDPGRARVHLLSGRRGAKCYACGHHVQTKPSGGRNRKVARIYCCAQKGCRAVGRNMEHLDAYVQGRTVRLLQDPRFLEQLTVQADQPDIAAEITALDRRRRETQEQLDALADNPDVDVTAALVGLAGFDRRLRELRQALTTSSEQRLLLRMAGISREQWDAEPVDIRSATVLTLWDITILPATHRGPGFAPESVRMVRRPLHADVGGRQGSQVHA
jgi:site-specific DNA recombinase